MGRWGLVFVICIFAAHAACAEDAGLKALSAKLIALRGTHGINTMRDAGPELTPIKHLLRRWVEAQLPPLEKEDDPGKVAQRLNAMLKTAGLTCEWDDKRCEPQMEGGTPGVTEFNARGYLSDVALSYLEFRHYLLLKTNVGVRCGFDESAYVYEWRDKGWHLLLKTEQDRYDEKRYAAQNFAVIETSPTGVAWNSHASKLPLILTLGISPWCASSWQTLYVRLWRASPNDASPAPLVDSDEVLFLGDDSANASLSTDSALIAFDGESVDGGVLVRQHVLHYLIHGDHVERIAPVALSPNDFVDEWLTRPWSESASWTDPKGDGSSLKEFYAALHGQDGRPALGEFDGPPKRCRVDQTLWQVSFGDDDRAPGPYFLIRWMAPYRFTLVKIQKDKFPGCDVKDAMPDNLGTLFPFPTYAR